MKRSLVLPALAAIVALAACSRGAQSGGPGASPAATNPVDFPLYERSTVISTRDLNTTISSAVAGNSAGVMSQGAGTYVGHQVIAKSDATFGDLNKWLRDLNAKPPNGYAQVASGSSVDQARSTAQQYGFDFAAFQKDVNGHRHGLLVLAIDPAVSNQRLGPVLDLVNKYKSLPGFLRDTVDAQVKQRTGMSVSAMLEPTTPMGAALDAVDALRSGNQRGIVLVDATKQ